MQATARAKHAQQPMSYSRFLSVLFISELQCFKFQCRADVCFFPHSRLLLFPGSYLSGRNISAWLPLQQETLGFPGGAWWATAEASLE